MTDRRLKLWFLMLALFLSGAAGLINQVVWQRALKVFLGGSETISSMIVVLVFLTGLGLGSAAIGQRIRDLRYPIRLFVGIEFVLVLVNLIVCYLLSLNLSDSIYWAQRAAIALGLPLRLIYVFGAAIVLAVPCLLMGMTLPFGAELCQRGLKFRENRSVNWLYAANTFGAVLGALLGLGLLLPHFGQRLTLSMAAGLNLAAAVVLWVSFRNMVATGLEIAESSSLEPQNWSPVSTERTFSGFVILAFGFGLCALWYEMFLYRAIALRHQPLPLVFSTVLAGFLLFWSLGTLVSSLRAVTIRLTYVIFLCILSELGALLLLAYGSGPLPLNTPWNGFVFIITQSPYFLPCFFFGILFGLVLQRAISRWGRDVARLSAWNTAGSCCGIVLATFVGYELNLLWMTAAQWFLMLALGGVSDKVRHSELSEVLHSSHPQPAMLWLSNVPTVVFGCLVLLVIASGFVTKPSPAEDGSICLFGRDGVIMIDQHRNLVWDGLWHSRLSSNNDHVGTNNWALAVDPILAHPTGHIREALVVGMGSGITVATLAKHEQIESVDVYEINQSLKEVLRLYPEGTLHVAENPKIRMIWQDGRSGLALRGKKYDLITQQPLYLKQAGASILLSKEYFRLVSQRLKGNGVFCVYANGSPEQALAVRQTGSEVFPHMTVLHQGYSLVFANTQMDLSPSHLESLLSQSGELWEEIRSFRKMIGEDQWVRYIENCRLALANSKVTIRDDFPIVEYPVQLRELLDSIGFRASLPKPGLFLSLR